MQSHIKEQQQQQQQGSSLSDLADQDSIEKKLEIGEIKNDDVNEVEDAVEEHLSSKKDEKDDEEKLEDRDVDAFVENIVTPNQNQIGKNKDTLLQNVSDTRPKDLNENDVQKPGTLDSILDEVGRKVVGRDRGHDDDCDNESEDEEEDDFRMDLALRKSSYNAIGKHTVKPLQDRTASLISEGGWSDSDSNTIKSDFTDKS